jgi:LuxR family maltose regulon positive regulatory protein
MEGALVFLQKAEELAGEYRIVPGFDVPVKVGRALLALKEARRSGKKINPEIHESFAGQAAEDGLDSPDSIDSLQAESEYLVRVRLLIFKKKLKQARDVLHILLTGAEKDSRWCRVLEILILQALLEQARGNSEPARACLKRALSLAEPEGFIRMFLDEWPAMAELLKRAAAQEAQSGYSEKLLRAMEHRAEIHTPAGPSKDDLLIEPLSEREIEVLRMLRTDLSGPEISEGLYISMNTLKTHMKNIYSKLGAHSRYEAVERAKKLNLIE